MLELDFGLPFHKLNFYKYILCFEKMFTALMKQDFYGNGVNCKLAFHNQLKNIASNFFYNFKQNNNNNRVFFKKVFKVLKNILNKSIYVTQPDKGKGI